ncbi:RNA polymerase sigma-70 factor (ECF subfamily) [Pedobacter psychrotolerans]|uniref:DNA-directed RNA polymerase sigma-70 factor n=1 Tax=Pedobacter psychrotolerans TaxID=1843235 RepID=A0A4R2H9N3_9SPHI|nr:RNA polymerase sigma-70 factor [Pedobacter psychrotolerans]TCO23708.1 RNA polymerase sigma-70 factor (ECF subfamily) [Pedobacter psychrotolerans]GGE61986.1 DNA-directed RNA polymerase sigma-70 factor [Pedobacter psychrotolerans]
MAFKDCNKERELIIEIVGGSEKAFSILFFNYLPILQSFALKFTKSEHAAEEVIQDAFLRIWLNRDKLEHVDNIKAYLYKYVSNECLSFIRKKIKEEKAIGLLKTRYSELENVTLDAIHLNEINRIIIAAVDKLPSQRRKIYKLSRGEGKSIPEIAEILGLSASTVKNALVIALKSIRENLIKHGISLFLIYFIRGIH